MGKYSSKFIGIILLILSVILLSCSAVYAVPASPAEQELSQPSGEKFNATIHGDEWFNWTSTSEGDVLAKDSDGYWTYAQMIGDKVIPTKAKYKRNKKPENALTHQKLLLLARKNLMSDSQTFNKRKVSTERRAKNKKIKGKDATIITDRASTTSALISATSSSLTQPLKTIQTSSSVGFSTITNGISKPPGSAEKLLVVLVQFTDVNIVNSEASWNTQFFSPTANSVNKYYNEVSNGKFSFTPATESYGTNNDGIIKVSLPYNHPNTGSVIDSRNQKIVTDALTIANSYIDFASLDQNGDGDITTDELHIMVIVAGGEYSCGDTYKTVWAHSWMAPSQQDGKWVLNYTMQGETQRGNMASIGVSCHELGHDLGLPDLYDYDYSSKGVGSFSVMGSGSWATTTGPIGSCPTHMDAWSKIQLGWVSQNLAASPGNYTSKAVNSGQYNVIMIPTNNPRQYFLIENRQLSGYDASLSTSSGGVAIWHIDEDIIFDNQNQYIYRFNDNDSYRGVDLEGVDSFGSCNLFRIGGKTNFNDTTNPSSSLYGAPSGVDLTVNSTSSSSMLINIRTTGYKKPYFKTTDPFNGALDIPLDKTICVNYSDFITPGSGFSGITLEVNGVFKTVTCSISGASLLIDPAASLDGNATYKLTIPANALNDFTNTPLGVSNIISFTTTQGPKGLAVIKVDPLDKELIVDKNKNIVVTFSEDIKAGPTFNNISVKSGTSLIPTLNSIYKNTLTIHPSSTLQDNAAYTVNIPADAVQTIRGVSLGNTRYYRVKTVSAGGANFNPSDIACNNSDTIQSQVLKEDTSATFTGSWAIATNSSCSGGAISYSSTKNDSASFIFNGTSIAWYSMKFLNRGIANVYIDNVLQGTVDQYNPSALFKTKLFEKTGLAPGSHTLKIEISGNKNAASSGYITDIDYFMFTGSDTQIPTGLSATSISSTRIDLSWAAPTDTTGLTGYLVEGSTDSITWVNVGTSTTPSYTDTVVPSGHALTFSFNLVDINPPTIQSYETNGDPSSPLITVTYNEPIKLGTSSKNITMNPYWDYLTDASVDGNKLIIKPTVALRPSYSYDLTIPLDTVRDLSGNRNETSRISFRTNADIKPPVVISSDPLNSAQGVLLTETITVKFNEVMNRGTNFFGIHLANGENLVPISLDIFSDYLVIDPAAPLKPNTTYQVIIPSGALTDFSGNYFQGYSFSFTTGTSYAEKIENDSPDMAYSSYWPTDSIVRSSGGSISQATSASATASFSFYGTGIRLFGTTNSIGGTVEVFIDNISRGTATQYSVNGPLVGGVEFDKHRQKLFEIKGLPQGYHSVMVKTLDIPNRRNISSWTNIDFFEVIDPAQDSTPPTPPSNLTATAISSQQVDLKWNAAKDEHGIFGYIIERSVDGLSDWSVVGGSNWITGCSDRSTLPGRGYFYRVKAYDAAGNLSGASLPIRVVTPTNVTKKEETEATYTEGGLNFGPVWCLETNTDFSDWNSRYSWYNGETATLAFEGTGIAWYGSIGGQYGPFDGSANVYIDGVLQGIAGGPAKYFTPRSKIFEKTGLAPGSHSIKIESLKSWESVDIDYFLITGPIDSIAPTVPANLVAALQPGPKVDLSWNTSSDNLAVTGYIVERSLDGTTGWMNIATSTGSVYTDTTAVSNVNYYYRVRATDAQGNVSEPSNVAAVNSGADILPPTAPSKLSAIASNGRIDLTWNPSSDNVGVTGYTIERSVASLANWSTIGTASTPYFSDTTVVPGIAYCYRVKAYDAAGNISEASNTYQEVPCTATRFEETGASYIGTWSNLINISCGGSSANFSNLSGNTASLTFNGTGVAWYGIKGPDRGIAKVYIDNVLQGSIDTFSPDLLQFQSKIFEKSGLTNGIHTIKIEVTGTKNTGSTDTIVDIDFFLTYTKQPSDYNAPAAPTDLISYALSSKTIGLDWSPSIDNVKVTGYIVERSSDGLTIWKSLGTFDGTGFADMTVSPNTTYYYRVKAIDSAGNISPASNISSVVSMPVYSNDTIPPQAPRKPLATSVFSNYIDLSWNRSKDVSGLTGYIIKRSLNNTSTWLTIGTSLTNSFHDDGVSPGNTYSYKIIATDAAGNFSYESSIITLSPTIVDLNIKLLPYLEATYIGTWGGLLGELGDGSTSRTTGDTATFTFKGTGVAWYGEQGSNFGIVKVYIDNVYQTQVDCYSNIDTSFTKLFEKTGLSNSTHTFTIEITGTKNTNSSDAVIYLYFITYNVPVDQEAPPAPTGLKAEAKSVTRNDLSWDNPNNAEVTGYNIERSPNGSTGWTQIGTSTSTSYSDSTITAGTTYYYRVKAQDAAGNLSAASNTVNIMNSDRGTSTSVEEAAATLTGTWTASSNASCSNGALAYSTTVGDTASYTFNGTGIAWYGMKGKNRGIAKVYIDDVLQGTIDQYGPAFEFKIKLFEVANLTNGSHTIKIEISGTKNASSTGYITDIDYFMVTSGGTVTPDTQAPTAPSNLAATAASGTQINLIWTASTDNVGVTGYNIERSPDGSAAWTQIGTSSSTSYSDTSVAAGATYYYRVKANDAAGNISGASNTANATTSGGVTSTRVEETAAILTGTWVTSTNASCSNGTLAYSTTAGDTVSYTFSGTGIAWYGMKGKNRGIAKVYIDDVLQESYDQYDPAFSFQKKIFEKTGLSNGTHTIKIEVSGDKNPSASGTITDIDYFEVTSGSTDAPDTEAPTAPSNLAASAASSTQINVTWTASTDNVGVTGYNIERSPDGSSAWTQIGGSTSTSYSDTTVSAGTTYYYRVKAKDAAGNVSGASNTANATTSGGVTSTRVEETAAILTGTWATSTNASCSNGTLAYSTTAGDTVSYTFSGTGITWYGMKGKNRGIANVYIDDVLQGSLDQYDPAFSFQKKIFEKTGLSNGTHTIKIEVSGDKNPSASGTITDIDYLEVTSGSTVTPDTEAPTAPSNLAASAASSTQISLTWTASSDNVGVTGYNIERSLDGTTSWTQIGTSSPTSYSDTSVAAGTTYYYRVKANDAAGNISGASNTANATTPGGVTTAKAEETAAELTGTWATSTNASCSNGTLAYSTTAGDTVSYTFSGTGIAWYGMKGKNRGIAKVYIDDVLQGSFDQYDPAFSFQKKIFEKTGLSNETHTIKIEVSGDKNPSASGTITDIDYFTVTSLEQQ